MTSDGIADDWATKGQTARSEASRVMFALVFVLPTNRSRNCGRVKRQAKSTEPQKKARKKLKKFSNAKRVKKQFPCQECLRVVYLQTWRRIGRSLFARPGVKAK